MSVRTAKLGTLAINSGNPRNIGLYVAYVDPELDIPYAKKTLLLWIDGKWGYPGSDQNYRGTVHGWIGPLPAFQLNSGSVD